MLSKLWTVCQSCCPCPRSEPEEVFKFSSDKKKIEEIVKTKVISVLGRDEGLGKALAENFAGRELSAEGILYATHLVLFDCKADEKFSGYKPFYLDKVVISAVMKASAEEIVMDKDI